MTCTGIRRGSPGQATAELVITLPVMLLLILGMIILGHTIFASTIVVLAANQGARVGSVAYSDPNLTPAEAYDRTERAALSILTNSLSGTQYEVDITTGDEQIAVVVVYYEPIPVPLIRDLFGGSQWIRLNHRAVYPLT